MSQWSSSLPANVQNYSMNGANHSMSNYAMPNAKSRRARLDMDNLVGSPFFLTTVSVAVLGWFIAFIASITANIQSHNFSHFAWWALMYQLCVILGVCLVLLYDSIEHYQMAICAFLATALSFTASTANALIYSSSGAQEAAAAGHIFLSISNILWILYFGTSTEAMPHRLVDSYSIGRHSISVDNGPKTDSKGLYQPGRYGTPYPTSVVDANIENTMNTPEFDYTNRQSTNMMSSKSDRDTMGTITTIAPAASEYIYRAEALYTYEANPKDLNEIGFSKGDIIDIADCTGKWYQARNLQGHTGIAPSNYLKILPMNS